ncbi:hypothetical protein TNCV_4582381 [Trichonephila clavipes]|nr:hypothetical protein TNCV_4582381 [Trichonephila clavipes]
MLDEYTELHMFQEVTLTTSRYRDDYLKRCMRFFREAAGTQFTWLVNEYHETDDIQGMVVSQISRPESHRACQGYSWQCKCGLQDPFLNTHGAIKRLGEIEFIFPKHHTQPRKQHESSL